MIKLSRIYTRTGDQGDTTLGNRTRVPKHHVRVEALGDIDEANAAIGIVRLHTVTLDEAEDIDQMLARIQNDLFDAGADLSVPEDPTATEAPLRITQAQVDRLEHEIDRLNARLTPLNSFVLPGGTPASAHLHLARTVVRRAERRVAELASAETINGALIRYLNRLSDHLFVLGRHLNDQGKGDVLWVPGAYRRERI